MMVFVGGGDSADEFPPDTPEGPGENPGASGSARDIESANRVRPGTLLIASTDLDEPTFARTVIYVIEHNDAGSLGVILNRMSQTAVHNLLPQWTDLSATPQALFIGGPVKQDAALCLGVMRHGVDSEPFSALRPVSGRVVLVDLDGDPDELAEVLEGVRVYAGYSGWGIGQLDAELEQDSWLLASALPRDLLAPATRDVWSDVLRRQPWPMPLLATHPIDVSQN
ncbi:MULTISPECIES: YqgE/AlgH family protein [unclassified Gordonia (in: high G+C Gram-positive bacteria)]